MNKIFGIGLPKTGTGSLNHLLFHNGIKSVHFGNPICVEVQEKIIKGVYTFDLLESNDAIINGFEMVFPQVDKTYPNSKFIYTVRDKDSWLKSVNNHLLYSISDGVNQEEIHNHLITYGCYYFNYDRFSYVYDLHKMMVKDYFKDRPDDILTVDIINDTKCVGKICDFLNIPVINHSVPHQHKARK